jgi:hypothetical protein
VDFHEIVNRKKSGRASLVDFIIGIDEFNIVGTISFGYDRYDLDASERNTRITGFSRRDISMNSAAGNG